MKIEWLLVWAEYWTADSEPASAAKAEYEVERQLKEQERTAYAEGWQDGQSRMKARCLNACDAVDIVGADECIAGMRYLDIEEPEDSKNV